MIKTIKSSIVVSCLAFFATALVNVSMPFGAFAQNQGGAVSGVVTDAIGPVAGAAVFVKDGSNGVTTDLDGAYTLSDLNLNDVIVVSLLGYESQEVVYTGQSTLDFLLREESTLLEGVVVTAMGIERQEESLTYAAGAFPDAMMPRPPPFETAAASFPSDIQAMPPWKTGYFIPRSSVIGVTSILSSPCRR